MNINVFRLFCHCIFTWNVDYFDMKMNTRTLSIELKTIQTMIVLYCRNNHAGNEVCQSCRELMHYAEKRLHRCPYKDKKPVCSRCRIHCYQSVMRMKIKRVMRFSGPRMVFSHPILLLRHLVHSIKS
jgi:hypothetical protein